MNILDEIKSLGFKLPDEVIKEIEAIIRIAHIDIVPPRFGDQSVRKCVYDINATEAVNRFLEEKYPHIFHTIMKNREKKYQNSSSSYKSGNKTCCYWGCTETEDLKKCPNCSNYLCSKHIRYGGGFCYNCDE